MKRVAPELDSLMWTLAEEGNERAIDEFGLRHPELRGDLIHRIQMVKGLRGAKGPAAITSPSIPRFVPREPKTPPLGGRPTFVVGGLVLAAVAMATFTVMTFLTPPTRIHKEDLTPRGPVQAVAPPVKENAVVDTPKTVPPPITIPNTVVTGNESEASHKSPSLRIDNAPLLSVLDMMSEITQTKIVAAPGLTNPTISVDYERMSAIDMLRDLGKRYAFTPLDQNDGSILVVPAVDNSGTSTTSDQTGGLGTRKIGG
ncbi:MAG: hypothetical protein P4L46_17650 [Fimbriimonas sp.]|nr:hypothetical protein [Fimbriimonas sp.]